MSTQIYDIPVRKITGEETTLGEFKGKVMLVVNVASKCGLTPQYEALENIYESYKRQGLVVVGFSCKRLQERRSRARMRRFRRSARRTSA